MRQADSTIKGFLYQFNKSLEEILSAKDNASITLEGIIEDIDIQTCDGATAIQCKYHEEKTFQISSVASPILDMLCHFSHCTALGQKTDYILYAYFKENPTEIDQVAFRSFLDNTQNRELILKYFHQIYIIPDSSILDIANKEKKDQSDKDKIFNYYKTNRKNLKLKIDISDFWKHFVYVQAEQFDILKKRVIDEFTKIVDSETANNLYYPNAFSIIADLSSKKLLHERIITRSGLLNQLSQEKSVLMTRWVIEATDKKKLLKNKQVQLSNFFQVNSDIRAFVFSDDFLYKFKDEIITFIQQYIARYNKKPKLHKPPIFIFGNNSKQLVDKVIIGLYKYQQSVNTGIVGGIFMEDSFISDTDCSKDYKCKITILQNINVEILEKCHVNQLYWIGHLPITLKSEQYITQLLDVEELNILKYLIGLEKTLEVS